MSLKEKAARVPDTPATAINAWIAERIAAGGPLMDSGAQRVQALAVEAAARLLEGASDYAQLHARKPLFRKTMRRRGAPAVLVCLDWPGVLRVFDPATGELLAESVPGQPRQLAQDFDE